MKIEELLKDVEILDIRGIDGSTEIKEVFTDSRSCTAGCMFIAVKGAESDGSEYIIPAIENGAKYIALSEESYARWESKLKGTPAVIVKNDRKAEAQIASNYYERPSLKLKLIGVTGTNGKTSIATLLYDIFTRLGHKCGLISTIANYVNGRKYSTINTTPGPMELNRLMSEMTDDGCEYCFMEVSSHSIDQERVSALRFAGGIFTNITHDHLDYHKTFANYLNCKKKFFDSLPETAFALTNLDDRNGKVMVQNTAAQIHTYSCSRMADFMTRILEQDINGMLLRINGVEIWCRFIGKYNAENLTAIYGAATLLGAPAEQLNVIMSELHSVSGRMEYFRGNDGTIAVVDYAHTPDALENVLKTLREVETGGDLICVFGCGGNRDKTKRPEMGAIAGKYASRIIVTSDNPRYENPEEIINDIKGGIDKEIMPRTLFITNRKEAIRTAVMTARPGSIILVAGKGHEDYQIINGVKHHMDDREIVRNAFAGME
ncbi:MAG: UDP-N-acetylmuramoyl-L-alanyl-D-glutamate--2,6-diaminopimelate ligase [Bacteroidales bacterium]|jgi:UDP-N-acetylmuramoyl-L-alanyl-D-glutamate--2,6-diaminopimelate ligase|nr:UDP-N-acetylmuramoyl-L-alanyl-D-glutamate--2,6-diaminopimelate ligase [Bacteroidales bacterium]